METPDREWERVARDLRSYRKEQRRQWGDVDEALMARYLTGGCSVDEQRKVERARREFPRVEESLKLVARVMNLRVPALAGVPQAPDDRGTTPARVQQAHAAGAAGGSGQEVGNQKRSAGVALDDTADLPAPPAAAALDTIPMDDAGHGTLPITDPPLTMPEAPAPAPQPQPVLRPRWWQRPAVAGALAVSLLVAAGGLGWALLENRHLREEARQLREQQSHDITSDLQRLEILVKDREAELQQLHDAGPEREAALRKQLNDLRTALAEAKQATQSARTKVDDVLRREKHLQDELRAVRTERDQ